MSLPLQAIGRLFDRMAATYGSAWMRQWEGVEANAVKSMWAHELGGFASNLKAIAWALEYLPERCPNLVQFKNLCRQAPAAEVPQLDAPKADPARVAAELAKLAPMRMCAASPSTTDPKAWAHRIIARHRAGEKLSPTVLASAQSAVGA